MRSVDIRPNFNEISRNPARFQRDSLKSPLATLRSPPLRSISFDLKQIAANPNRSRLSPWFSLVDSGLASLPPKSRGLILGWAQTRLGPTHGQAYPWHNTIKSHYKKLINLHFLPSLSNWNNHLPSKIIVWLLFYLPLWLKSSPSLSHPYDRTPFFCSAISLILIFHPSVFNLHWELRCEFRFYDVDLVDGGRFLKVFEWVWRVNRCDSKAGGWLNKEGKIRLVQQLAYRVYKLGWFDELDIWVFLEF